jgi:hypothetical protein
MDADERGYSGVNRPAVLSQNSERQIRRGCPFVAASARLRAFGSMIVLAGPPCEQCEASETYLEVQGGCFRS